MTWATASVLVPFLDWPFDVYFDDCRAVTECGRSLPGIQGNSVPLRCGSSLGLQSSAAELLQEIRRHAGATGHKGVTWHLQVRAKAERLQVWTGDAREPSPEEIAVASTTPDGSYWRLDSGAVVAELASPDETAQRYRIVAEVER